MNNTRKQTVTLSEVAKVAGMSKSAVSKALLGGGGKTTKVSEKNILRIREIADSLGYRPNLIAQQLAHRRNDIIGAIIDSQCCTLYNNIMSTIEHHTFVSGRRLQVGLVHDSYEAIKRYVDDLLGYGVESVICLAHYYPFADRIPPLFRPFKNTLFISKPMTDEKFSFVSPDYYANFRLAADYLLELNRRRIIFAKVNYRTFDAEVREQALRDAYRDYGATMRDEFIYKEPLGEINTRELTEKMLDDILPLKPDALILGNAVTIQWCLRLLPERGFRVPEDISIVGMDDWNSSKILIPSVTTIDNNYAAIGRRAVEIINANAAQEQPAFYQEFIRGQLCIGTSCVQHKS